jgi:ATP-dependent Clp protease protease subunit
MRQRLGGIFSEATGQTREKVERDTDRNYWLDAEQAREYGLVFEIVTRASELRKFCG